MNIFWSCGTDEFFRSEKRLASLKPFRHHETFLEFFLNFFMFPVGEKRFLSLMVSPGIFRHFEFDKILTIVFRKPKIQFDVLDHSVFSRCKISSKLSSEYLPAAFVTKERHIS